MMRKRNGGAPLPTFVTTLGAEDQLGEPPVVEKRMTLDRALALAVALVIGSAGGAALVLSRAGCAVSSAELTAHAAIPIHPGAAVRLTAVEQVQAVQVAKLEAIQKQIDRVEAKIDKLPAMLGGKAQP